MNSTNMKIKKIMMLAGVVALCGMTGCGKGDDKTQTQQGMDCVISQDYANALTHFNQGMLEGDDLEEAYRGLGLAYMGQRNYTKAISSFKSALSNAGMFPGPLEYDINNYMAIAYYKIEDYESAISVYDNIIALRPKDANAYYMRGSMHVFLDQVDAAIEDFDQATTIAKNNYSMYIDVYACLQEYGYAEQGQKYIDTVLSVNTTDINDYDKGRLCYYQGEYQQGCNYLERARKNGQSSVDVVTLLSECYKQLGQFDYAALVYSTYLASEENPEMYNQLGLCYASQGDYDAALTAFQNGAAIKENNTCMQSLLLNEIACYEYKLDFVTAKEKLDQYLDIYPATDTVKKEYAFLTTR